ncbi:MAG: RNA polymerase sigma factor [Actinomycetota bacterium]
MKKEGLADLVEAASNGDEMSWSALVDRFAGLVWAIARGYGLSFSDAADVSQTAWLRVVENLDRIQDPERLGAWLSTTVRHECFRVLKRASRQVPVGDLIDLTPYHADADVSPAPEAGMIAKEEAAYLWRALETLSPQCRALLRVLMADPTPTYAQVAAALGMPIGGIGPTRARCLNQLRRNIEGEGISKSLPGSS